MPDGKTSDYVFDYKTAVGYLQYALQTCFRHVGDLLFSGRKILAGGLAQLSGFIV